MFCLALRFSIVRFFNLGCEQHSVLLPHFDRCRSAEVVQMYAKYFVFIRVSIHNLARQSSGLHEFQMLYCPVPFLGHFVGRRDRFREL